MGTGGTITGVGRYLRERNPKIRIVGVDPVGSILYETHKLGRVPSEPHPKTYKTEGIGEDFLPTAMDLSVVDEVLQVGDKETMLTTRRLVREEGIFAGGSSGTAVAAALRYCRSRAPTACVVVILPDSGDRVSSARSMTTTGCAKTASSSWPGPAPPPPTSWPASRCASSSPSSPTSPSARSSTSSRSTTSPNYPSSTPRAIS